MSFELSLSGALLDGSIVLGCESTAAGLHRKAGVLSESWQKFSRLDDWCRLLHPTGCTRSQGPSNTLRAHFILDFDLCFTRKFGSI
jgi:hypothetical protein